MPPKSSLSVPNLPTDPMTALKTAFGSQWKAFEDALTNANTTLEAQRGFDKAFFGSLLGQIGFPPLACAQLAHALLAYFTATAQIPSKPNQMSQVSCIIPSCKKMNGIRSLIYHTAQRNGACYSTMPHADSIKYVGDDLHLKLLFTTDGKAVDFRAAMLSLNSPPASLTGVSCTIATVTTGIVGNLVSESDYNPTDSDSPFTSLQCLQRLSESSCSVVSQSTDLFRYQMIENSNHPLFRLFKPERAHIVPTGKRYRGAEDDDNFLALYRVPMHQLFDGIETEHGLPQVKLSTVSVSEQDPTTKRYPVRILVKCRTKETYDGVLPFIQVGAVADPTAYTFTVTVHVVNHVAFTQNIATRAEQTQRLWDEE